MAGIARIHIISDWKEPRLKMSQDLEPAANKLHWETFLKLKMPLKDRGIEIIECAKEQAMARYDWQEGIDCILYFANGHKATMQEKYLDWKNNTITFTEHQKNNVPGNWYTSTAQYWFTGYAREYNTKNVLAFSEWIYIDLPALHRIDAARNLRWQFNDNRKSGYLGIGFRFLDFDDVPPECLVLRSEPITPISSGIHWPESMKDDRPLWPLVTYQEWLRARTGTPEQLKRYAEAVTWYRTHP